MVVPPLPSAHPREGEEEMMRFTKVAAALWRSKRFRNLPNDSAKLLYMYFVTCEHQNSIGAFVLRDGYAIDDLGWSLDTYVDARKALIEVDLIDFDDETSTVYVERWFKHSPPMNEKHSQGCQRLIGELECERIMLKVQTDFEAAEALRRPPPPEPTPFPISGTLRGRLGAGR
jgi:hypothetical protein